VTWKPPANLRASWSVAALYVDQAGPYADLVADGQWYDQERDARTYAGDLPVVAHPSCGPWGKLAWRCQNQDKSTGLHAVAEVRRCGGILEHPVGSGLFDACGIPTAPWTPERTTDEFGGYTLRFPQWNWGHRGDKGTIVYIVGTGDLPPLPVREGGVQRAVERMGKRERRLTPPAFAWWMCSVAYRCGLARAAAQKV
jgi:hypothetical protein